MNTHYWHEKWHTNKIGFNQKDPNLMMQRYFKTLALEPGGRIFVPLCGKSVDMLWLMKQGYEVIGVEVNEQACKAFFEDNNLTPSITKLGAFQVYSNDQVTLFTGDFFKLKTPLLGIIDAVYDRAALIALPIELRQRYVAHLSTLLTPQTSVFLITISYDQHEMQGPPFSVDEQEVEQLFSVQFNVKQLYSRAYTQIPEHLHAKGLLQAKEEVYCLIKKH